MDKMEAYREKLEAQLKEWKAKIEMLEEKAVRATGETKAELTRAIAEVMGLTVRSRNIGSQIGAGLKSIMGGELRGMTKALTESRQQVIDRMVEEAEAKGANAILAMRFDTSELGGMWTEICAYGTAVKLRRL